MSIDCVYVLHTFALYPFHVYIYIIYIYIYLNCHTMVLLITPAPINPFM